jgi:hypothetical protein
MLEGECSIYVHNILCKYDLQCCQHGSSQLVKAFLWRHKRNNDSSIFDLRHY